MSTTAPRPLAAERCRRLSGHLRVPGDKSISHRALMFGALATGTTRIRGLLEAEDVVNTAKAVSALGAPAQRDADGTWQVRGRGVGGLNKPDGPLDFGNSGTGTRLMLGVIACHDMTVRLTAMPPCRAGRWRGCSPLCARWGSRSCEGDDRLPLTVRGTARLVPIRYELPVASAQVKSAILMAGLGAAGTHHGGRDGGDPRPHRAHAAPLRRRGRRRATSRRRARRSR